MFLTVDKTLDRIKNMIEKRNKEQICIVSANKRIAQAYSRVIKECFIKMGVKYRDIKIYTYNTEERLKEAAEQSDKNIMLLCGSWYTNKVFVEGKGLEIIKDMVTIPIGDIPTDYYNQQKKMLVGILSEGMEPKLKPNDGITVNLNVDTTEAIRALEDLSIYAKAITDDVDHRLNKLSRKIQNG